MSFPGSYPTGGLVPGVKILELSGPGATTVHKSLGADRPLCSGHLDGMRQAADRQNFRLFFQVNARCGSGQREGQAKIPRVEAGLVHPTKGASFCCQSWYSPLRLLRAKGAAATVILPDDQGCTRAQAYPASRKIFHCAQIFGVEANAQLSKAGQLGRVFRILARQHTGCRPGGLTHGVSFLQDAHAKAVSCQFQRSGKADNPRARYDDFCTLHSSIVG